MKGIGGEIPDIEFDFTDAGEVKGLEWPIALVELPLPLSPLPRNASMSAPSLHSRRAVISMPCASP